MRKPKTIEDMAATYANTYEQATVLWLYLYRAYLAGASAQRRIDRRAKP